jgi:hypothetical protein
MIGRLLPLEAIKALHRAAYAKLCIIPDLFQFRQLGKQSLVLAPVRQITINEIWIGIVYSFSLGF